MRVRLHSLAAGPDGVLQPGEHDLAEAFARALVAGGYAVPIDADATPESAETDPGPEPETTEAPRPATPKRKGK
ncbi:hypothetical protein [Tautonia plasticadhaerens]|uniref:Uncharacterized protein n=1 Tax=Tautonia plasticadhaerens TaxID=2527974 RepID=A0A518GZL8_9BACT|nr:hypothetical protein [Tautonia plasticadhaerens]QDV34023.1 hypothetical protein ElP_19040 [Tautonia plasticadhaerens]